jgi:outer membrane protein, heavy metal efflux system
MTARLVCGAVLATLVVATQAAGQVPVTPPPIDQTFVDPVNGLSLEQAIDQALAREPSLRAARSQIDAARGGREQAALRSNPTMSFEHREEPAGSDRLTTVGVQWPLELFRRGRRIAVADRELAVTQFDIADRERLLASEVRTRYGDVLVAIRELALLDELLATSQRQYATLQSRAEAGASPPLERDLLEVDVRRLESDRLLQRGQTEAALFELKRVLGVKVDEPLRVRERLESVVERQAPIVPAKSDASAVTTRRADVRAATARVDLADAKIARARSEGRFDITAFASYMRMDTGFPQRAFAPDGNLVPIRAQFDYVSAGAMVTIPVLNRRQGELATARAEQTGAIAEREAATLTAETEIAAARTRDDYARQAAMRYGATAQSLARRNLTVVTQSYELGRVTIYEVLAEQRRYFEVERGYTNALRSAYEARTMLVRALGELR